MRRDLEALAGRRFDLVIVGGGIFGACAAWDAALRGLDVALVERYDFGGQTSANSFKMVHGGIRYMQHGDLVRVRESCRERSALLRIAPHLVRPLPVAVPTHGLGKRGKPFLAAGMLAYDLATLGRNRGIADPGRRIPWARLCGRDEILEAFPGLERRDLTGAAVFCDAQMYNPPRLVLSFLCSACAKGAVAANYVEATGLLLSGRRVVGIRAQDAVSGECFPIRANAVLNATGPWAESLIGRWLGRALPRPSAYSRDACFVVRRRFQSDMALALPGRTRDSDAVFARGARHLFIAPWRDYTLIGVWHKVWSDDPDRVTLHRDELDAFVAEADEACPGLGLTSAEVLSCNAGLLPFGDNTLEAADLSFGKRSILVDHAKAHGIEGLITLIGIRYTMGRGDAAKAVDLVTRGLGRRTPRPATERIPVFGGAIADFEGLVRDVVRADRFGLSESVLHTLVHNHGSACHRVLAHAEAEPGLAAPLPGSTVLRAEVVHAVREEMARSLGDVAFRRTDLATGGPASEDALMAAADLMARELDWSAERCRTEREAVRARPGACSDRDHDRRSRAQAA